MDALLGGAFLAHEKAKDLKNSVSIQDVSAATMMSATRFSAFFIIVLSFVKY